MRVAIVAATFFEGLGYQENVWIKQLLRAGHAIRVLTPGDNDQPPRSVTIDQGKYEIQVLSAWHGPRTTYLCSRVGPALKKFEPDLVLWFGAGTFFGKELVRDSELAHLFLVSFYSASLHLHEYDWRKPDIGLRQRLHAIIHRLLRGRILRAACRRSQLIIATTPTTGGILLLLFKEDERKQITDKTLSTPLGFDPDVYRYDTSMRQRIRADLGIAQDDMLVCMSSRFDRDLKAPVLNATIRGLQLALEREPKLKALVVGLIENKVSQDVRALIARGPVAKRFLCHEFGDQTRLNELFNASDIALFGRASISCQAALGTGLVLCAADEQGTTNHLATMPGQGHFFRPRDPDDMAVKLVAAAQALRKHPGESRHGLRRRMAEASRWLGYDRIVASVMKEVCDRLRAG